MSNETFNIWHGSAKSPTWNMAADELLLRQSAIVGQAVLRLYSWNQPSSSFGYFQRYAEVSLWTDLRPLIRRPTGGGLVRHDENEWTYSLTFPSGHAWWKLKAEISYQQVHNWIRRAFERCGVMTELCSEVVHAGAGQCFIGAEKNDLLYRGKKIAGAAQRRNREGLLIQGSIQAKDTGIERISWESAMLEEINWKEWHPAETFIENITTLSQQKYELENHNLRR